MRSNERFSPRSVPIAAHVGPRTMPATTRAALAALGYVLGAPCAGVLSKRDRPVLRIVDDCLLGQIPSPEQDPDTPIVLITTRRFAAWADPRVIAQCARPAQLDDLFPILEETIAGAPRQAPRTRVSLAARCIQADRRWLGAIVELSTSGCQVESGEWRTIARVEPGSRMNLHFSLPDLNALKTRGSENAAAPKQAPLSVRAEIKELRSDCARLEFCEASDELRGRVARYVAATLAG